MLTLPDPAFQQSRRKRIALQHWATTVVPAEAGDHDDLHLPCQFKMLFLSSSVYFFPYNVLREVFLGETVHQICLSYTRWVYFEDGRVSTFSYLNFCTSQRCLMQIWQLQEINLVCWQCRPWWALRKKENAARFGNSFQVFCGEQCAASLLLWDDSGYLWMERKFCRIWSYFMLYYSKSCLLPAFPAQAGNLLD